MLTTLSKDNVILISIHANASGNGSQWIKAQGRSAYTSKGQTKADILAESLLESEEGRQVVVKLHVDGITNYLALSAQLQYQNESSVIVQSPIAQLPAVTLPSILCLTTYTNHMEILNRCRDYDERVFYILYAAHQHLKVEELKRCIVNQTFDALMDQDADRRLHIWPSVSELVKHRDVQ